MLSILKVAAGGRSKEETANTTIIYIVAQYPARVESAGAPDAVRPALRGLCPPPILASERGAGCVATPPSTPSSSAKSHVFQYINKLRERSSLEGQFVSIRQLFRGQVALRQVGVD